MHARMIRRNSPSGWWRYVIAAILLIGLQIFALLHAQKAHADINVSYINLQKSTTYASQRAYAGSVVAGRTAQLGFKRGGQVQQVQVDEGDQIEAGQILAQLTVALWPRRLTKPAQIWHWHRQTNKPVPQMCNWHRTLSGVSANC